jgi:hypothetical protein
MSPAEVIVHSSPPPGVGRIIHVFSDAEHAKAYAHHPMAAIVVQIDKMLAGREHPMIWVQCFSPPMHAYFNAVTRNDPCLLLPAIEGERDENGVYWKWPPRVNP